MKTFIFGASGFAREVEWLITEINNTSKNTILVYRYVVHDSEFKDGHKINDILVIVSKHDKQPNYTFPCTNDIDNICEYTIKEYKISNRLSLIMRYDNENIKTLYIEYKHSQNVDIDKINEQINKIIAKILH